MRKNGISMTQIERKLGIPRSTLSGWFKDVRLTEKQRTQLMQNSRDGWQKARQRAVESHNTKKSLRLMHAEKEALAVLEKIDTSPEVLDLAFAMLYFGEGAKKNLTAIGSSDPVMLRFALFVLKKNYGLSVDGMRFDLHLRADQDPTTSKQYWARALNVPVEKFKYVAFDKRTIGKPTRDGYKGVCLIACGNIAIQRKLIYLYNHFCEKVARLDEGT